MTYELVYDLRNEAPRFYVEGAIVVVLCTLAVLSFRWRKRLPDMPLWGGRLTMSLGLFGSLFLGSLQRSVWASLRTTFPPTAKAWRFFEKGAPR